MNPQIRRFKWDKWLKLYGSRIPDGYEVEVIKFLSRRRVIVKFQGKFINTMLWCVPKTKAI